MFNRMQRRKLIKKARSKLKEMQADKKFKVWLADYALLVMPPEDLLSAYDTYKSGLSPEQIMKMKMISEEEKGGEDARN